MSTPNQGEAAPGKGGDAPQPKEKGKSDDKLIGNRKVRTVLLCSALFGFSLFAAGYLFLIVDKVKEWKDAGVDEDATQGMLHGARCIVSGLVIMMFATILTAILVCLPTCDPNKFAAGRFPGGLLLLLAAGLYLFGWIYYITKHKQAYYDNLANDDVRDDQDAFYLSWFGEALIYGGTAVLLALDILLPFKHLCESEGKRLFSNLGLLAFASILNAPAYFMISKDDSSTYSSELDAIGPTGLEAGGTGDDAAMIGAGYVILFVTCLAYVILFTLERCGVKVLDLTLTRVILALLLIAGGLVTAIGYWWYAGEGVGDKGDEAKSVAYYVGYTGLVGGLCVIWSLDIAWDDDRWNDLING